MSIVFYLSSSFFFLLMINPIKQRFDPVEWILDVLTSAPLCEHHLPHSTQQHVQLLKAQFHSAAQSLTHKSPQRRQPLSLCLSADALLLAEGHHDLAKSDVKGQGLDAQQSILCCVLFTSEDENGEKGQHSVQTSNAVSVIKVSPQKSNSFERVNEQSKQKSA